MPANTQRQKAPAPAEAPEAQAPETDEAPQTGTLIPITGLWKTETRNGGTMLSGQVSPGCRLVILRNDRATGNQPTYRAFWAPSRPKREDQAPEHTDDF